MDRALFIAMSGARETMKSLAMTNHNLANANTHAFKQDIAAYRSMPIYGNGLPSRAVAMTERAGVDFAQGALTTTGRDLDVALDGPGWLVVETYDANGEVNGEALTRNGALRVSPEGVLVTSEGHAVLGAGGPINVPPREKLDIAADGTISLVPEGALPVEEAVIGQLRLVNPDPANLYKGLDGMMRTKDDSVPGVDPNVRLVPRALEQSNVNPTTALVEMIEASRKFELQVKTMKAAEENERNSDQLLRVE
jgi:flagellar basal-body rod protein FlgF